MNVARRWWTFLVPMLQADVDLIVVKFAGRCGLYCTLPQQFISSAIFDLGITASQCTKKSLFFSRSEFIFDNNPISLHYYHKIISISRE